MAASVLSSAYNFTLLVHRLFWACFLLQLRCAAIASSRTLMPTRKDVLARLSTKKRLARDIHEAWDLCDMSAGWNRLLDQNMTFYLLWTLRFVAWNLSLDMTAQQLDIVDGRHAEATRLTAELGAIMLAWMKQPRTGQRAFKGLVKGIRVAFTAALVSTTWKASTQLANGFRKRVWGSYWSHCFLQPPWGLKISKSSGVATMASVS
jgi:hypothetical protein